MNAAVGASYRHCQHLSRRAGSSFYLSFYLLPRDKRRAMFALYAFLRQTDDFGDGELGDRDPSTDQRRDLLGRWRQSLEAALAGRYDDPLWPALIHTIHRYRIPTAYLFEVIRGVEMDLGACRYETFEDLTRYCYSVASVVGLACIHIWGFRDPAALEPARCCGLAFQLTNILRDLKEDAARDRVYLPLEDLRRFDYTLDDLKLGVRDERLTKLVRFEIDRAERLYLQAASLGQYLSVDGRRAFRLMTDTYRGLLEEIKRRDGDVFTQPVRLGSWRKFWVSARVFFTPPRGVSLLGGS